MWDLIALPTLNVRAAEASLSLAAMVFQVGLLSDAGAGDIGYSAVPLSHLHGDPAQRALRSTGVEIRLRSRVERIVTYDGDLDTAATGDAVTLTLADEIDIGRGNVLAAAGSDVVVSDQIAAHVVWMAEEPLLPGRAYVLKSGAQATIATITELKHKINVDTLEHQAGKTLELNEVGFCNLSLSQPLVFDPYKRSRAMGGFILIDRFSDATLGAGMVEFGLRRATNIKWQAMEVGKDVRAGLKGQTPCVLWLTGLSGAGKSTVANLVEKQLAERGRHTYVLDGDNVRHGLNKDLGFTDADRVENVRRVAETARKSGCLNDQACVFSELRMASNHGLAIPVLSQTCFGAPR